MPRKKATMLTNAEHRIMEVIWARGSATVAEVVEALKDIVARSDVVDGGAGDLLPHAERFGCIVGFMAPGATCCADDAHCSEGVRAAHDAELSTSIDGSAATGSHSSPPA